MKNSYKINFLFLLFIFILIFDTSANADDEFVKQLLKLRAAKKLECVFPSAQFAHWEGTSFKRVTDEINNKIYFDAIDHKSNKAKIIGNSGSAEVLVFSNMGGLTFIEKTNFDNSIFTTVFPMTIGDRRFDSTNNKNYPSNGFITVMSRHLYVYRGDSPMMSQWYGVCSIVK